MSGQSPKESKGGTRHESPRCARRRARWTGKKSRKGSTLVEFAIVLPIYLVFVFAIIEYGRMVLVQQIITNAAREGARVGVLDNSTGTTVSTAANQILSAAGIASATISATPNPPSSATYASPVTVTVSVPFSSVTWLPSPMYLGGKTLTSTSIMRRESLP
jgi:Flp pilus assembly protein TadG